jgi:omega-amidase
MRIALLQFAAGAAKAENLRKARELISRAAESAAQLIVLPECFNSPYGTQHFAQYAETLSPSSESYAMLSEAARTHKVHIVGGSIPEKNADGSKLFNTCMVFNPSGDMVATFRKMHLFNINIPGKIQFFESQVLTPGEGMATFSMTDDKTGEEVKIGLGICFDIRFPELAAAYVQRHGCKVLVYPGAFNMTTGPVHWELLAKVRAMDNQCYLAMCSPARDTSAGYVAYGHSLVCDPWADVVAKAGAEEEIVIADLDMARVDALRAQLPVGPGRRDIREFFP